MSQPLDALIGEWTTEATHPAFPGVVGGRAVAEWLEGEHFLILRSHAHHADAPDSIAIIGPPGEGASTLAMFFFDSRGVHRVYETSIDNGVWKVWRDAPGFSQRFVGSFEGNDAISGLWQLSRDGSTWNDDLRITYRRV